MSEICPSCWKKRTGEKCVRLQYKLSKDLDICEDCGEDKRVIVVSRWAFYRFKWYVLPLTTVVYTLYFIYMLLRIPYTIYEQRKASALEEAFRNKNDKTP